MHKIILHVGHGKTGSSYLQSCLAINSKQLSSNGIHYPYHSSFKEAESGEISSGNGSILLGNHNHINKICRDKDTLFSNENFYFKLHTTEKEWFYNFAKKHAGRLKIILFTRNYFELYFSLWAQNVKRGRMTKDIDTFLKENKVDFYAFLQKWVNLSNQYNFELKVLNYSNYKKNLWAKFLEEILVDYVDLDILSYITPERKIINRSLTSSEYEIQRICNKLTTQIPPLSDLLVNQLPNIKPMKIMCKKNTYHEVKDKYLKTIDQVNKHLSIQEQIQIEEIDRVTHPNDESDVQSLSIEQIDLISEYLGEELHKNRKATLKSQDRNTAIQLRDIALKIGNNKETTLDDAIHLMAIAQSIIPESAFISNTIENWKIALHRMRINSQK